MFIIEFTKFLKKGNNMDFLEKLYLDFRKENIFGFAHFFISMFLMVILCAIIIFFFDQNYLINNLYFCALVTFFVGLIYELYQHGIRFYLVKDSRGDIYMNIFGISIGFLCGIGIFTLTVWFI